METLKTTQKKGMDPAKRRINRKIRDKETKGELKEWKTLELDDSDFDMSSKKEKVVLGEETEVKVTKGEDGSTCWTF